MDPLRPRTPELITAHTRGPAYRRRIGGSMLIAGGVLALLTTAFSHPEVSGGDAPTVVVGLLALALGGLLVARPELAPQWATPYFVGFGTVLITLGSRTAGVAGGTGGADSEVLYLLVVLYSFYFLTTRQAVVQLAFVAVAYGTLLLEAVPFDQAGPRWAVSLGTLSVAGMLVHWLNLRVESLIEELNAGARRDPLTGTLNRRGLDERLGIEIARARRTREPLCVLTVDLDDLKDINDRYGHAAGDEALELSAEVMIRGLRDLDVLARTGGDEFVVLLPNCASGAGLDIAEQLLEAMRSRSSTESWPATLSVGVAAAPPLPLDPEALVAAADRALYRAKALGKDRASMAGGAEVRRALDPDLSS